MKKVLVGIEISNTAGRNVLSGILKYVSTHTEWHTNILSYPEALSAPTIRQAKERGVDGIIVNHVGNATVADELRTTPIPLSVVDVVHPQILKRRSKIALIGNRNDIVGVLGARKFLSLGKFRSFVFIAHPDRPTWSEDRKFGYCTELKRHGITPIVLIDTFADELLRLPRPIAVMSAWDYKAIEVLDFCRERGFRVPDDMSVIGVDADPLICGFTIPSLSSVAPDFERLGYCAAAALDSMMAGHKLRSKNIVLCRPKGLVERASTRFLPPAATLLNHAKEIIERDAIRKLTVRDLALRLGVSQQLLALRFRQFEKRSVRDIILETRLAHVKELLKHPRRDFTAVAKESGFNSANRLAHLFKEKVGMSLGEYARTQTRRDGTTKNATATATERAIANA